MAYLPSDIFVIPDPGAFPSGGNLYNAFLLEALGEQAGSWDWDKVVGQLPDLKPGRYWFDTLYLERLMDLRLPDIPGVQWGMVIHHLESLFPPEGVSAQEVFQAKEQPVLEKMYAFLTSSPFTTGYLQEQGLGERPILTVPPALVFDPPQPVYLPDSPVKVLVVANLVRRKGILPLLEALDVHLTSGDALLLTLAGSENLEPDYAQACKEVVRVSPALKGRVSFLGSVNPDQIQALYAQQHLCLSAAFMETYGMAMQEAVACGLPLLAFEGGNAAFHIQEGLNGFLCATHQELAAKLLSLIRNPRDLSRLREMARSYNPYASYSWKNAASAFLSGVQSISL